MTGIFDRAADVFADVDPWPTPAALAESLTSSYGDERRWERARHLDALDAALVDAVTGVAPRLLVMAPPRHGKSLLCSRWLPLWHLRRHPDRRVVVASYASDYAAEHGRAVRDLVDEHGRLLGLRVRRTSSAASRWDLEGVAGGMVTVGMGGSLTGRGASLLVLDDPHKAPEDVATVEARDKVWAWWSQVALTRLEPGAAVVLVMTRWHEDDLAGRLLQSQPGRWRVLRLPAVAEVDDELGRREGEPLWPRRFDVAALARVRDEVGARAWSALYQQAPTPAEGAAFLWEWIEPKRWQPAWGDVRELLSLSVVGVDPAVTSSSHSDETGIVAAGVVPDCPCPSPVERPHFVVMEDRTRRAPAEVWASMAASVAESWGASRVVAETNQGADLVLDALRRYARVRVEGVRATVGKSLRAAPVALAYERGRVHHVAGLEQLERQMTSWHEGQSSPDRLDALVHAMTWLLARAQWGETQVMSAAGKGSLPTGADAAAGRAKLPGRPPTPGQSVREHFLQAQRMRGFAGPTPDRRRR